MSDFVALAATFLQALSVPAKRRLSIFFSALGQHIFSQKKELSHARLASFLLNFLQLFANLPAVR